LAAENIPASRMRQRYKNPTRGKPLNSQFIHYRPQTRKTRILRPKPSPTSIQTGALRLQKTNERYAQSGFSSRGYSSEPYETKIKKSTHRRYVSCKQRGAFVPLANPTLTYLTPTGQTLLSAQLTP
jgi:hypothetical protein